MKATCTKSSTPLFEVGCSYEVVDHVNGWVSVLNLRGVKAFYGRMSGRRSVTVDGVGRIIAKFKMPGHKSHRKMLVRAFTKCAKERGWGDSKNGAFKSWSGTPYKNAKDWARWWAENYVDRDGNLLEEFAEYYDGDVIDQSAIDGFVDEELDSL